MTDTTDYQRALRARTPDLRQAQCPSRDTLDLVANKWTPLVIGALAGGISRNGGLLREIEGISQKMLTQTLRRLETHGLVHRVVHEQVPPRVDYHLTELAHGLVPVLGQLCHWAETNMVATQTHRAVHQQTAGQAGIPRRASASGSEPSR